MLNIPIYRAKKIDSDEYVQGYFVHWPKHSDWYGNYKEDFIIIEITPDRANHKIDPTTLSIHLPDMLDSEGTKIFASLSESGRGGDIVYCEYETYPSFGKIETHNKELVITYPEIHDYIGYQYYEDFERYKNQKVIGIQND